MSNEKKSWKSITITCFSFLGHVSEGRLQPLRYPSSQKTPCHFYNEASEWEVLLPGTIAVLKSWQCLSEVLSHTEAKYFPCKGYGAGKVNPPPGWGGLGSQQHGQLACVMHSAGSPGRWKCFHVKAVQNGFLEDQTRSSGNDAVMRTAVLGEPTK